MDRTFEKMLALAKMIQDMGAEDKLNLYSFRQKVKTAGMTRLPVSLRETLGYTIMHKIEHVFHKNIRGKTHNVEIFLLICFYLQFFCT